MSLKNYLLFKRDLLLFWSMTKIRVLNSILLLLIIMGMVTYQIKNNVFMMGLSNSDVHFSDIYLYLYWGVEYHLVKTNHFPFPIIWLVLELIPFYILGDAFKVSIMKYSLFLTGRSISKKRIFTIKSLVLCFLFVLYQGIILIFTYITSLIFFKTNIHPGNYLTSLYHQESISGSHFFLYIMIQILFLLSLLFISNCLVLMIKSIYSMLVISCILFFIIYSPAYKIVWISSTMFSRIIEFHISEIYIILIELFLIVLFYFIGNYVYQNKEYS